MSLSSSRGRRSAFRPFAAAAACVLLVASAFSQQNVTLGPTGTLFPTYEAEGDFEPDLNCDEVRFQRAGVHAIIQDLVGAEEVYAAAMRRAGKVLMNEVVLGGQGGLTAAYESGLLFGLEFDWFFPEGPKPPTANRLEADATVWAVRSNGTEVMVARVYGYTYEQYFARKAAVEAMIGHPMNSYAVWADDALVARGSELLITGLSNEVRGMAVSAGDFRLHGVSNSLHDGVGYGGALHANPENSVFLFERMRSVEVPTVPFSEAQLRNLAQSEGTYVAGDLRIEAGNLPPSGLVFAEGSIVLATDGHTGNWTLVSATGKVAVTGEGNVVEPALAQVAVIAFGERLAVSGDSNRLMGEVHAPRGTLEVSGSGNMLRGISQGESVVISGSSNTFTDGTHPIPTP